MLCFLLGGFDPPRLKRVFLRVREEVAHHEYGWNIQATKEGRFTLSESLDADGQLQIAQTLVGPEDVWFSPLLVAHVGGVLSLDNFRDGAKFGNGATGRGENLYFTAPDGTIEIKHVHLSIMVFPYGMVLTGDQWYHLQEILEGVPPGSPERNVWRPFPEMTTTEKAGIPPAHIPLGYEEPI